MVVCLSRAVVAPALPEDGVRRIRGLRRFLPVRILFSRWIAFFYEGIHAPRGLRTEPWCRQPPRRLHTAAADLGEYRSTHPQA
jgi:hypothetical protein